MLNVVDPLGVHTQPPILWHLLKAGKSLHNGDFSHISRGRSESRDAQYFGGDEAEAEGKASRYSHRRRRYMTSR